MKYAFAALFALACVAAAAPLPVPPVPVLTVPESALGAVKAAIPKGWTAEAKGDVLTVRRDEKVKYFNPIGAPMRINGQGPTPTGAWGYEIHLWFRPKMTEEAYADRKRENADLAVKFEAMRNGLREAKITHKFDEYLPNTPEQRKLVAEYRAEQKRTPYHSLPNYCSETHALEIGTNSSFTVVMTEQAEIADCQAAMEAIQKLFKPFPMKKAGEE